MTTLTVYPKMLDLLADAGLDWAADTIKCALLEDSYVYDAAHDFFDDVSADEASGTGYTAGGVTLGSKTNTYSAPWRILDAADPSWATSTISAQYAVFYKDTGSAATSPLLLLVDAEEVISSLATTFSVPIDADGLFRIGQTA